MDNENEAAHFHDAEYERAKLIQRGSMLWRARLLNVAWFGFGFVLWSANFFDRLFRSAIGLADLFSWTTWLASRWTVGWFTDASSYQCPPAIRPYYSAFEAALLLAVLGTATYLSRWVYFDARVRAMESGRRSDFSAKACIGLILWVATFLALETWADPIYQFLNKIPT